MASLRPGREGASSPAPATYDLQHDPFVAVTSPPSSSRHRFSNFDSQVFALGPSASPAQAKRALEAHLAETDRRMEEAGKLGTALLQQHKELSERLREVEKQQAEGELSDDLRQKLVEIEKDYNEVARESARAFLPKQRVPSNEAAAGSPFVPEGKGGRRSVSPSKFEGQATGSPTKFSVPNRKLRNQPTNRIHDVEFMTEVTTSLIDQVRNLQGLLVEKEDELKEIKNENSKLEYEAEGIKQRVKTLDESEHRYKDENWNLETQIHDLIASQRDAADREKRLTQLVNAFQAEKNAAQRELDEAKLSLAKLSEEHAASNKQHDIELGTAKRNIAMADAEQSSLRKKVEDLTGQNQELAKAVSASLRGRVIERESILGMSDEDFETAHDKTTPEHSPPPSPVKGTPRHSMLESETLKTSLSHAQRTIQGLRSNVHREKTEKLELKRMLQEARDELEKLRQDPLAQSKRARKADSKELKKPPRLLGNLRSVRSEVFSEDSNWEDQPDSTSPTRSSLASRGSSKFESVAEEPLGQFETANDTSDAAFETANERATETDDFHTGAEEFSSDEDAETETESPLKRRTPKVRPPSFSVGLTRSGSMHSTASTEDEDYGFENDMRTPTVPPLQQRFPLRVSRGAFRRSRQTSEEPIFHSSPPSIASSAAGTPQQGIQSLAAELGEFDASDNESNLSVTPSRRSFRGRTVSPPPPLPPLPRVMMVDNGTMTDELPEQRAGRPMSLDTVDSRFSTSSYDSVAHDMDEKLAKFPSPPTSPPKGDSRSALELEFSGVHSHDVEPISAPDPHVAELAALQVEHEKALKDISDEKTAAYNAALEDLKSRHSEQLNAVQAEASLAHSHELESLRSSHGDEIRDSIAEVQAAHARELEALKSSHADEVKDAVAGAQIAFAQELESLKSNHAEEISKVVAEAHATHAKELEALKSSHANEISKAISDARSAHLQEQETLKTGHAEDISKMLAETRAAHAREIEELRSGYADQAVKTAAESQTAHGQELEALKTTFADQISQKEWERKAAHDAELEALRSSHAEQIAIRETEIKAAHTTELEAQKAKHVDELNSIRDDSNTRHAAEIAALAAAHSDQINQLKSELVSTHANEVQSLQAGYAQQLDRAKQQSDAAHSTELDALKAAHSQQVEEVKNTLATAHAGELNSIQAAHIKQMDDMKKENADQHAAEVAALVASHSKQIDSVRAESEAKLSRELGVLKETHAQEIDALNSQHAATRARELEAFKAVIDKQIESSKMEGNAAHSQQIEALNAAHAEVLEAQKRDSEQSQLQALESLKAAHERHVDALKSEATASRLKELDGITSKHLEELDVLKQQHESSKNKALEDITVSHSQELEGLRQNHVKELAVLSSEHESGKATLVEELTSSHSQALDNLRQEIESSNAAELAALHASHAESIDSIKSEHEAVLSQRIQELAGMHSQEMENLRQESDKAMTDALAALIKNHSSEIDALRAEHETIQSQKLQEVVDNHTRELESLHQEGDNAKSEALSSLVAAHTRELENLKSENQTSHTREFEQLKTTHAEALEALRTEHQSTLDTALDNLKNDNVRVLEELRSQHAADQSDALEALNASYSQQLAQIKRDADATLAERLEALQADHTNTLDSLREESAAEMEKLLAHHATELEALRKSLEVEPPTLGFSPMTSTSTEPIEVSEPKTPRREAFIIPREDHQPQTPPSAALGLLGRRGEKPSTLEIAEDDTRQSPSAPAGPQTPESQRPFKEISTNTDIRPSQRRPTPTFDQSSQTTLTSDGLDQLLKRPNQVSPDSVTITTARGEVTVTPFDEERAKQTASESGIVAAPESIPVRRPGSSASVRGLANRPPLPSNHREAIEAARTGSSGGGKGTMGPPLFPASAYKAPVSRPETPSIRRPMSPSSVRGTPTPRAGRSSLPGHADVHSPTRVPLRSRQSSVSSFASEIDTRFNIRGEMGADPSTFGPNTDPRMIQAITQTMIGEYLWKYTRKTGRGELSENRHRRYFWVHPYTRTLYWSDRDPSSARQSELKAKSIPIEAVRIVADDNPMPPGLHRKSLVIISPGRTIKFTCTTGQRHETWFNALSYLLLRTGNEAQAEAEEVAGQITQEDVDEFNPSIHRRPANGNRARAPPSLSSYNSRTTHNGSPNVEYSMSIPTLTPTRERETLRSGTLGRLSGYWKSSTINSTFTSLRSRSNLPQDSAIYEASEVPDSAEDLRQLIEHQDRTSDRLENVRACCDGKHDVGTLSHTKRGRIPGSHSHTHSHSHSHSHSHTHPHPGPSTTPTPVGTTRARG